LVILKILYRRLVRMKKIIIYILTSFIIAAGIIMIAYSLRVRASIEGVNAIMAGVSFIVIGFLLTLLAK